MKQKLLILISLLAVVLWVVPALAFTYQDSYGSTADFSINGNQLQIVLTSGRVASNPGDVLTALFFTSPDLFTPVSANITGGSSVIIGTGPGAQPTTLDGSNVGGEWEYLKNVVNILGNQGIGSAGLDIFGSPNFNGPNLQGPDAVDGGQFGLVNRESDPNLGLAKKSEVSNQVTFLLNVPAGFSLTDITNPKIWYGTEAPPVPIPPSALLLGSGLLGLVGWRRFRKG